ncbi:4'-phosphopantetheinyl transferase family protein [Chitinimonas koreensis]|uniref:4'-phosphopantetheinyl transferase family protein n=2 Tax=Chitinimonas koreensis TaxID=356302 RepID=UPI0012F7BA16|nr:4'-phosphopantetheinyl transferase superfamily protein [Chitinimonas koreensis]
MTGNSGGLTRDSRDVTRDDSSPAGCALLPLAPGELHLWYGFPAEMAGTDLASHYAALLSEDERARHGAFLFAEDAQRYLFTRALVRTVLSRYADVAPGDWVFSRNAHGKPAVAGPDRPGCAGLSFNVSHAAGLVVMAVGRDTRIGVDVESLDRPIGAAVVGRVLTADEAKALCALPAEQRGRRFVELWTLKESWLKAIGTGLDVPPRRMEFAFVERALIQAKFDESLIETIGNWQFLQFMMGGSRLVAICTDQTVSPAPRCWRTLPLEHAMPDQPVLSRCSQRVR